MKRAGRHLVCLTLSLLVGVVPAVRAATDPGFLLTATSKNLDSYFPGELANGYLSTFTSPRGTESNLSYLVAFMDYGKGDISRPAAIPGWTGIDYRAGPSTHGFTSLNQAPLAPSVFQDYRQVLNLHDATLSTSYRYVDHGRLTRVEVLGFASEASPHLAVIRFSITPEFAGVVEVSFPLRLWATYQPRLPLAKLTGKQLPIVLAAHGLSRKPIPPSTPDRAALWYHGYTRVLDDNGDTRKLTLWLDGRARNGLRMGEAVAVGLPPGVKPLAVQLHKGEHRLSLDLRVKVEKGRTYVFTKYVAVSRAGWGGDAAADRALAVAARGKGFTTMLGAQRAAWAKLWESDIRIVGDPRAQQAVHSDLYYLLANVAPVTAWGVGACGLTTGYVGHVFWDSDSWIFPALLLLHPQRAKSIVMFRDRTLPAAIRRAHAAGYAGAKYPWEADPENGSEQVLYAAHRLSVGEIHVNADIAIAQWQYWLATHDLAWLHKDGWPVIRDVAEFWTSRATWDAAKGRYDIQDVVSLMEPYAHVDNDAFTNAAAAKALRIATAAAALVGAKPDPRWARIADKLYIPFAPAGGHHLGFAHGKQYGPVDADLAYLAFPSLDLKMRPRVRRDDYRLAVAASRKSGRTPGTMGLAPLAIAAAALGDTAGVSHWLDLDDAPDMLKRPFNVRTETPTNNTGYFLTGSAGYVQAMVFGLTGLRMEPTGLIAAYPPVLPAGWKSLTLTNVTFRKRHYDITVDRGADGKPQLHRAALTRVQ